ncbi:non-hydrolyzing UDP-N-acetylglucosamine 2-epimerase [Actinomyces minihominis]|uniref:non-hydrolyzing UDP-N-acetylglucosamine 2-epimerase n=1 Tax=Actinomyces minihominis TaxID=2002838 RepID=UPI000C082189|nr:UDP-N-acetylglucosamine 2-epimerase (non-hydrolyzing) [Actinomyces minihominis]
MKKVLFVFGTRPEAIKMAPMIRELKGRPEEFEVSVCVTGQHREMLYQVLDFFSIKPDFDLEVMKPNQSLFGVTSSILVGLEPVLDQVSPDVVLVQGDTTSVLVGALGAFYKKIKVGHLEAGLRSGDLFSPFPEEGNRLLATRLTDFHFTPTPQASDNLLAEGVDASKIHMVGNTVIDALFWAVDILKDQGGNPLEDLLPTLDWSRRIVLVTGHRRESFGDGFQQMCAAISRLATDNPNVEFIYPVHLNPNVQKPVEKYLSGQPNIHLIAPLDYPRLIWLMERSYFVLTDSGGIQEEAPSLGKPVLVMRNVTERMEGVTAGTARLVGTNEQAIYEAAQTLLHDAESYDAMAHAVNPYGDGTASRQMADILATAK